MAVKIMEQFKLRLSRENNLVFYVLLALASMNFVHSGSMLMLIFNLCILFYRKFLIVVDKICILYILLTGSIIVYAIINPSVSECIKALNYVLCYWMGNSGYRLAKNKFLFTRNIVLSISCGCFIYLMLLIIINIDVTMYRMLIDVWTDEYIAVTLVAVVSSFIIASSVYFIFFEDNKAIKIIAIIILFISFALNFRTATRTPFVLLIILIIFTFYLKYKSYRTQHGKLYLFIGFMFLIGVLFFAYLFDLFSLRTSLENSFLWNRFIENDSDSRIRIMLEHLKYSFKYPFGGGKIGDIVGKNAHNAVQNFYDNYGFFAGISYLIITISQVISLAKLLGLKDKQNSDYLLIIVLFTMSVQMWTEPIVTGYPIYIWIMCIIHGITCAHLGQKRSGGFTAYESNIY